MLFSIVALREDFEVLSNEGAKLTIFSMFAGKQQTPVALPMFTQTREITDIELLMITNDGFKKHFVPRNVRRAVVSFLHGPHLQYTAGFDCHEFARTAVGAHGRHNWKLEDREPNAGEVIALHNKGCNIRRHSAVYIGDDLYLSVFGEGGHLVLSSLTHMQKAWHCDKPYVAIPSH